MNNLKYLLLILIFVGFTACDDDDDYVIPGEKADLDPGSADFSTYVAVGNSLTAGFTDGALFKAGQNYSLPNILAQKMALAGGGDFTQPMMNDNIGGLLLGGTKIQDPRYYFDGAGPAPLDATPTTDIMNMIPGPYNNMGIPGAKAEHFLYDGYGNIANLGVSANPYFVRMASSPNATVLGDAMALSPTFFSLWIGENEVLGHAMTGADGSSPMTDAAQFEQVYGLLVSTLTSGGAKGVATNIPDVTAIPFFTTVPYNPLDPANPEFAAMIDLLNGELYNNLNMAYQFLGLTDRSPIVFSKEEPNPMVIRDESLTDISAQLSQLFQALLGFPASVGDLLGAQFGQVRPATEDDLFVLTSMNIIAQPNVEYYTQMVTAGVPQDLAGQLSVYGVTYPLQDKWVLTPDEQQEIVDRVNVLNATIKSQVDQAGLAFVNVNSLMNQLATSGLSSDNFDLTADLVTGGAFSLDGVHLTARGYALIAEEMLKSIDVTYGSNFEEAGELPNLGDYPLFYPESLR
ncbi:MAG: G-D-S-L family lipolytic protein [Bacteroidota bacterium]